MPRKDPKERLAYEKNYVDKHRERYRQHWRNGYKKTKRFTRYGLTEKSYIKMLEHQSGLCAICTEPMTKEQGGTCVDHDHRTGKVRALLCVKCNSGIGYLRDDPAIVSAALSYLELYHG